MASNIRCHLGRIRRFQLRARLGSPYLGLTPKSKAVCYPSLWIFKPIVISDRGGEEEDDGEGSNDGGSKDNNHQSRMNRDSNRGTGMGNNMAQGKLASLTVHNIVPPPEDDGIGGYQLLYLE